MSHIAEVYAKDLGVKIGQPKLTEHFVPGLPEKYISLQASNKMPSKDYQHWQLVLELLMPYLESEGIQVVQVGGPEDPLIQGVNVSHLGSSYRQMNFIIKNAQAHLGVDSLPMHVASAYDRPLVALFGNLYVENAKPLWNHTNKAICLEPDFSKIKPSFGTSCDRINEIKPEVVAQSLLDILNIKEKIKFKTVRIGAKFNNSTVEIVPNFFGYSKELQGKPVNIRGDLHFDLESICKWCQFCQVNLTINKVFNLEALAHMPHLKQVVFKHEANENTDITPFLKILKNKKVNVIIEAQDGNDLSELRLKYFDFHVFEKPSSNEVIEVKASKYLSKKRFITHGQSFASEFSAKKLDRSNIFSYDEDSSKELENLYLYDEE